MSGVLVSSDFETEFLRVMKRADGDDVALFRFSDAMPNGILYEGLRTRVGTAQLPPSGSISSSIEGGLQTSLLNADVCSTS